MLNHLRRFASHKNRLRGEGFEKLFQQRFFGVGADADDGTLGFFKRVNRLAEPQIFRRAGEMKLRKFLFQFGAGADGELG